MNIMMAQMGLSALGDVSDFMAAKSQAKVDRRMQQYRNTLTKLSAARQNNALTINENRVQDAAMIAESTIQQSAIVQKGRAVVAAAAAGVMGNTVDVVQRDLQGSANKASYAQRRQANQQLSDLGENRKSIAINTIIGQDVQVIPKPSPSALLLGAGTNLLSIYDSHQPEGSRLIR